MNHQGVNYENLGNRYLKNKFTSFLYPLWLGSHVNLNKQTEYYLCSKKMLSVF